VEIYEISHFRKFIQNHKYRTMATPCYW